MEWIQEVREFIVEHQMVPPGERVLVAVSGGPDSVCLAHLLCSMRNELQCEVGLAHLNHCLRGEEADEDEEYVQRLGQQLNVPTWTTRRDVATYGSTQGLSIQVAAREVRFAFLDAVAKEWGARRIALAHHRNDQAETVLLRMVRGTGVDGLAAILPMRDDRYIHPLLKVRRVEIEEYCTTHSLHPRYDSSNNKLVYLRNRIRRHLLPIMEEYNPDLQKGLADLAEICRGEAEYLGSVVEDLFPHVVSVHGETMVLQGEKLCGLPLALQRRILQRVFRQILGNSAGVGFDHVEASRTIILSGVNSAGSSLPQGLELRWEGQNPVIGRRTVTVELPPEPLVLPNCGERVWGPWQIEVEAETIDPMVAFRPDGWQVVLSERALQGELRVRSWETGDRYRPIGMNGSRKLQDIFADAKVPRTERKTRPVIVDGQGIVWVAGFRPAERVKITDDSIGRRLRIERRTTDEG